MPPTSQPDAGPPAPLETVDVTPLQPQRLAEVLTGEAFPQFEQSVAAAHALLRTRTIWNVNPTAFGGGVAEMLRSLIGYVTESPHLLLAARTGGRSPTTRMAPRCSPRSRPPGTSCPRRAPPGPPRDAADGGCRGERDHRQRAPAPGRRRGPEERR